MPPWGGGLPIAETPCVGKAAEGSLSVVILPQGAEIDRDRAVMGGPCVIVRLRG